MRIAIVDDIKEERDKLADILTNQLSRRGIHVNLFEFLRILYVTCHTPFKCKEFKYIPYFSFLKLSPLIRRTQCIMMNTNAVEA